MKRQFMLYVFCLMSCWLYGADDNDSTVVRNLNGYSFENVLGEKVTLETLDCDYIFLEIWSMSCGPCLREMEYFKKLPVGYKGKPICFVAICIENNVGLWKDFLMKRGIGGIQWITPILGAFQKENKFFTVPRFVVAARKGNIVWDNANRPSNPALKTDLDWLFED